MDEILYNDIESFGQAMYKTGQLLKLTGELRNSESSEIVGRELFELEVDDNYKELVGCPVEMVTECHLRRYKNGTDK